MDGGTARDAEVLRGLVQRFVRGFGLLAAAATPCGQPLHTSHAHALMILREVGGDGLHQSGLARALGIDRSNASRLVRLLAAGGHVAIGTSPDEDARLKRVRLTAKGSRLAAAVERASRDRFEAVLGAIAPGRRRTVLEGLAHLNEALARAAGKDGA